MNEQILYHEILANYDKKLTIEEEKNKQLEKEIKELKNENRKLRSKK